MITKQEFLTTIAPAGHSIEWFSENVCHCVVCGCSFLVSNSGWMLISIDGGRNYINHTNLTCSQLIIRAIIE